MKTFQKKIGQERFKASHQKSGLSVFSLNLRFWHLSCLFPAAAVTNFAGLPISIINPPYCHFAFLNLLFGKRGAQYDRRFPQASNHTPDSACI